MSTRLFALALILTWWAAPDAQVVAPHVLAVASDLANNGVPAGFVVPHSEFRGGKRQPFEKRGLEQRKSFRAALPRLMTDFQRGHKNLSVGTNARGVIHVRPVEEPPTVSATLEKAIQVKTEPMTVRAALDQLPDLIREEQLARFGLGGGGYAGQPCQWSRHIKLDNSVMSVTEYLDQIVEQVPGFVWFMLFDETKPTQLSFALACEGGWFIQVTAPPVDPGRE